MSSKHVILGVVVALVPIGSAVAAPAKGGSLHATMTGKGEVPKGDPDGSGTAEIKISGTKVCWEIKAAKIGAIGAAHIHKGGRGVAGPVVVPLGKTFASKGCTTAPAAVAAAIQAHPGSYYVNVHNVRYPSGALRGQLKADDSQSAGAKGYGFAG